MYKVTFQNATHKTFIFGRKFASLYDHSQKKKPERVLIKVVMNILKM